MKNPETNPFSLFFRTIAKHYAGVIAITLVACACYLWLTEKPVPNSLENLTLMVVSFLFGKNIGKSDVDQSHRSE
jgi:hypothetical protein